MHDDEVTEVRRVRHEISAECSHDVRKVAAYYRSVENELKQSGEFRFEEPVEGVQLPTSPFHRGQG